MKVIDVSGDGLVFVNPVMVAIVAQTRNSFGNPVNNSTVITLKDGQTITLNQNAKVVAERINAAWKK